MEELLTIPEAAKRIRRTPAALYKAISQGNLVSVEKFGRQLVALKEVKRYKKETRTGRPRNGARPARKK